jgi:hypothetical protein
MVLLPIGVAIVIAVILFGGPAEALDGVNEFLRDVARLTLATISALR